MKGWPGEPDMEYDVLVADGEAAVNAGKPITDVIFDFGNVLIYWDPAAVLIPRYDQATIDRFLDNDISRFYDANDQMDGGATPEEGVAWMREHSGDQWADMLKYYLDNFEDSLTGVVPGARVLVNDLKAAGIGVWGLSNWEKELFPIAERATPILQQLDGKVVSGYVKLRKPHKDIYERALQEFGITADGAVFIDDKAMNIVGANAAGIRGVRFRDPVRLRELLIEAGVGIPDVQSVE
ncbi:HAD family phosphatase [Bifidobacterium sp. CP2]|uniref:HAD family hydrolase n=1 Tax=Bifidobacterium TaxID=1678 RepID=UPI001BDD3BA2|nr:MULTISPECIES: HAD family phosphatase [Bifidobacterium]MBT1180571.1 HAD family phosphatase [Bifidobacterium sp. CP2]MBW3080412.1 HAD family phosphatase [Bifidobacterium saguinibicoloris]